MHKLLLIEGFRFRISGLDVEFQDAASDGKYVLLENTHRSKEEPIGEWRLKRKIDGKREIVYTFPRDFILKPGKSVKVINPFSLLGIQNLFFYFPKI